MSRWRFFGGYKSTGIESFFDVWITFEELNSTVEMCGINDAFIRCAD